MYTWDNKLSGYYVSTLWLQAWDKTLFLLLINVLNFIYIQCNIFRLKIRMISFLTSLSTIWGRPSMLYNSTLYNLPHQLHLHMRACTLIHSIALNYFIFIVSDFSFLITCPMSYLILPKIYFTH